MVAALQPTYPAGGRSSAVSSIGSGPGQVKATAGSAMKAAATGLGVTISGTTCPGPQIVDATNDAGRPQSDDAPVVIAAVATPTGFPAVHPFAALGVFAFAPLGRAGLDQVFLRREKLVVGGNDRGAEAL